MSEPPSLMNRLSRNIRFKLLAETVSRFFSLVFFLVLAHALGDRGYGRYAFPLAFSGLFVYFSECGLNTLMIRQLASERAQTLRYLKHHLGLKTLLSVLTFCLIIGSGALTGLRGEALLILVWAAVITLAQGWQDTLSAVFNGLEQIEREVSLRLQNRVLTLGTTLVILFWSRDILLLMQGLACAYLLSLFWGFSGLYQTFSKATSPAWETGFALRLLKEGMPFWLSGLFALLYFRMDVAMLYQMGRPEAEVGWYQAVVKLLDLLILLPNLLLMAIYPVLASLPRRQELGKLVAQSMRMAWIFVLPVMLGGSLLASEMIPALLGAPFAPAAYSWQILLWALLFVYFNHISLYSLAAIHRNGLLAWSNALGVLVNGGLNFFWIPRWGMVGASYSTVLTEILVGMINLYWLSRLVPLDFKLSQWSRAFLCSLMMAAGVWELNRLNLHWLVILPSALVFYLVLLVLTQALSPAEMGWLRQKLQRKAARDQSVA
ncbi:hypothetical protein COW36_14115 [bacterium (Candidatus Blackallbacteria) CG17_big_fil_post_rev_8_21_14_2_50_48_46]|uniref:Uncharacterized protein n=1 Tax=bacterium (Candidatus Blackallbacteria) CG17_big_fil_post_rev_8_21_14_2_50_48_46 TaxID=2014261 RepID=A0A2M7G349_9BACT|nr:MAG: hypothetical protein COW64_23585 [bacterium (Candidatus Blackallbacteria) CG18_big_fil_WC_8_21_14_2_50_49_26]PIW16256.1 MAG: hypothetical protein COW36_14115 [bacterium (Candidatus Blackallbacteria) CG17_big_fil_post_rev_8_21_14_2_50_48_46]PIW49863.1 MAG: hypothetical protein COW20_04190 [bacterium (Candidatus Blackallbacteria) CG13_big_fil_rev_8_21_14_2_50_49_14]